MKEKIITALRTKYQRFGLSSEAVDRIASAKEKTVTKEEDIEAAIADAETMELIANELQKSADAERRNRSTLQKSFDDYKKAHPEKTDGGGKDPDEENEVLKELRELKARLDERDASDRKKATLASVTSALKKAGCSNEEILSLSLKGFSLGENETEDAAVARIKADYDNSVKKIFGDGAPPPAGGGGPKSDDDYKKALEAYAIQKGLKKED